MGTTGALLKDSLFASLSTVNTKKSLRNELEPRVDASTASSSPDSSLHSPSPTISGPVYPIESNLDYASLPRLTACKPLHYASLEEVAISVNLMAGTAVGLSKNKSRRHVRFENIEIRRYPMILGDNPSCRYGCPVSLGWEYEAIPTISVDDYEDYRIKHRPRRRGKQLYQLILNYYERQDIFARMGLDPSELKQRGREILKIQRQRKHTAIMSPLFKVEDVARSAGRKVQRAFLKRHRRHHAGEDEGHHTSRQHSHCAYAASAFE